MSDYQALQHMLDSITIKQSQLEDGHQLRTSQIFEYLGRVMYNRRTKMDPLWNSLLVAGWETNKLANDSGKPSIRTFSLPSDVADASCTGSSLTSICKAPPTQNPVSQQATAA